MALGYVALASGIVLFNITELPAVIKLIREEIDPGQAFIQVPTEAK